MYSTKNINELSSKHWLFPWDVPYKPYKRLCCSSGRSRHPRARAALAALAVPAALAASAAIAALAALAALAARGSPSPCSDRGGASDRNGGSGQGKLQMWSRQGTLIHKKTCAFWGQQKMRTADLCGFWEFKALGCFTWSKWSLKHLYARDTGCLHITYVAKIRGFNQHRFLWARLVMFISHTKFFFFLIIL